MIQFRLERFSSKIIKRFQTCSVGPFKNIETGQPNANGIGLPHDYGISTTFNIENLIVYKDPEFIHDTPFVLPSCDLVDISILTPLNIPWAHKEHTMVLFCMNRLFLLWMDRSKTTQSIGRDAQSLVALGFTIRSRNIQILTCSSPTIASMQELHSMESSFFHLGRIHLGTR